MVRGKGLCESAALSGRKGEDATDPCHRPRSAAAERALRVSMRAGAAVQASRPSRLCPGAKTLPAPACTADAVTSPACGHPGRDPRPQESSGGPAPAGRNACLKVVVQLTFPKHPTASPFLRRARLSLPCRDGNGPRGWEEMAPAGEFLTLHVFWPLCGILGRFLKQRPAVPAGRRRWTLFPVLAVPTCGCWEPRGDGGQLQRQQSCEQGGAQGPSLGEMPGTEGESCHVAGFGTHGWDPRAGPGQLGSPPSGCCSALTTPSPHTDRVAPGSGCSGGVGCAQSLGQKQGATRLVVRCRGCGSCIP